MVLLVREFIRTRDPLIRDPLNTYTQQVLDGLESSFFATTA